MLLRVVLLLGVALALAKNPTFPTWPNSYQTEIVADTGDGTPSQTTVYIDYPDKQYRYDVESADGTVTELVFVPPNPSVRTFKSLLVRERSLFSSSAMRHNIYLNQ